MKIISCNSGNWIHEIRDVEGNVYIKCDEPKSSLISQKEWNKKLAALIEALSECQRSRLDGQAAVATVLKDFPEFLNEFNELISISYVEPSSDTPVYSWPDPQISLHKLYSRATVEAPFKDHPWNPLRLYRGNGGPVANVQFSIKDAIVVKKEKTSDLWLALLEACVGENSNDAILQRMALVEVRNDGTYTAYENDRMLENAGLGGPYDPVLDSLIINKDGSVTGSSMITQRNVQIAINTASFSIIIN